MSNLKLCRICHSNKVWDKYKCAQRSFEHVNTDSECENCHATKITTTDCEGRPFVPPEPLNLEIEQIASVPYSAAALQDLI